MKTIPYSTRLTKIECGDCHIPFAIPTSMHDAVQYDGALFSCPNGHQIGYHDTAEDELRRQLAQAEGAAAAHRAERDQARRQLVAAKGRVTKMRNRIALGVCPCCKRQFKQVVAHMENKHPDVIAEIRASRGVAETDG